MVNTTCKQCGKEIRVRNYRAKNAKNVFCSYACNSGYYGAKTKQNRINKTCPVCKSQFTTTRARNSIFCGRACVIIHNATGGRAKFRKKIMISCPVCGKGFQIAPSRKKYAKQICCSIVCRAKNFLGSGNPAYIHGLGRRVTYGKNWNSQRRKAIARDNNQCQVCGYNHKKQLAERDGAVCPFEFGHIIKTKRPAYPVTDSGAYCGAATAGLFS